MDLDDSCFEEGDFEEAWSAVIPPDTWDFERKDDPEDSLPFFDQTCPSEHGSRKSCGRQGCGNPECVARQVLDS